MKLLFLLDEAELSEMRDKTYANPAGTHLW